MIQSAPFDPLVAGHLIVEMGNLAIQKKNGKNCQVKITTGHFTIRPFGFALQVCKANHLELHSLEMALTDIVDRLAATKSRWFWVASSYIALHDLRKPLDDHIRFN